jgi:hypothetical protein
MLWVIRVVMLSGYCASACLLVLGSADVAARRWKRALAELGAGLLGFGAGVIVIGVAASTLTLSSVDAELVRPEAKARLLGAAISSEMKWAASGFAVGVAAGAYLAGRRRRAELTAR